MKSLNIDIIVPWEYGLVIVILSLIIIFFGVRQSKKEVDDFDRVLLVKPTTKIFFGAVFCLFGFIQMLQLLK